jgi:hypothetical protein
MPEHSDQKNSMSEAKSLSCFAPDFSFEKTRAKRVP